MAAAEFLSPKYLLSVLKEGYRKEDGHEIANKNSKFTNRFLNYLFNDPKPLYIGQAKVSGAVTLIQGPHNILVGTGTNQDGETIIKGLQAHKLSPNDIEYVICTHAHPENLGNLNLFPSATIIVGYDIMKGDLCSIHHFSEGVPYEIDEDVEVIPSPGLSAAAVTVMVANSNLGIVAVASGVFHCEGDLEDPDLWTVHSADAELQEQSRIEILKDACFIVPRYGNMFRVPDAYKGEMQMIMTP